MLQRLIIAGVAIAAGLIAANGALQAQTLDKIRQRGVLVVGTKADYKPFGFRDPSGAIVGFEPDLARDVAARLGVRLELEPVASANRIQFLQQGKIDLMLATMNVTDERRKTVGIIEPSYYASGVNVFANRKVALERWEAKSAASRAPSSTSTSRKNTAPRWSHSADRTKPRPRFPRAIASPGSTTTPLSWSASRTPNGRGSGCRWRPSCRSRGAPP